MIQPLVPSSSYFVFDGTEHKPSVHLKVNNKLLTEGTDYEITYDGDLINAGTVKLTVTGIGVYYRFCGNHL